MEEFKDSILASSVAKCEENIQSAELLLETKDTLNATRHIRACKQTLKEMSHPTKRKELEIKCRSCHGRIFEADGKYLAASYNYFEISKYDDLKTSDQTTSNELSKSLHNSIKCAILAKPCDARDKLLKRLYQDKRSQNLLSFKILKNMHQNRIISQQDQDDFGKTLPLNDQLKFIGEYTILQKATYEHNMRAISKLYKNIRFMDLSMLLGVSMEAVENFARLMIQEKRLHGTIDQIDKEITFDDDDEVLYQWNDQIKQSLLGLQNVMEMIKDEEAEQIKIENKH
eukprot:24530_1